MHALQWSGSSKLKRAAEAGEKKGQKKAGVHPYDDGVAGLLQGQRVCKSVPCLPFSALNIPFLLSSLAAATMPRV